MRNSSTLSLKPNGSLSIMLETDTEALPKRVLDSQTKSFKNLSIGDIAYNTNKNMTSTNKSMMNKKRDMVPFSDHKYIGFKMPSSVKHSSVNSTKATSKLNF